MAKINIRTKGANGEREIADMFIDLMSSIEKKLWKKGYSQDVKRNTLQSDRGGFDLVGIPGIAPEIKRQENLSLNTWWQQTEKQAKGKPLMPVLIYRQSRQPWKVITYTYLQVGAKGIFAKSEVSIEDFLKSYAVYYEDLLNGNA